MTTHILASIKDNKAGIYFAPQVFRSKADFIRNVQVAAKDKSGMLNKFPSDYELHVLADWSEYEGVLPVAPPERLGTVLDLCPLE